MGSECFRTELLYRDFNPFLSIIHPFMILLYVTFSCMTRIKGHVSLWHSPCIKILYQVGAFLHGALPFQNVFQKHVYIYIYKCLWRHINIFKFSPRKNMDNEEEELMCLSHIGLYVLHRRKKKKSQDKKKRKWWIRPWIARRNEQGAYHNLIREMKEEDHDSFADFFRLFPNLYILKFFNFLIVK